MHEYTNKGALICSIVDMHEYLISIGCMNIEDGAIICNIVEIHCSYLMSYGTSITV